MLPTKHIGKLLWLLPSIFGFLLIGCKNTKRVDIYPPAATRVVSDTTRLTGMPASAIRERLGEPPVLARLTRVHPPERREVWVYFPSPSDPTGFYFFFRNDTVAQVRRDEFAGICSPIVQHWLMP